MILVFSLLGFIILNILFFLLLVLSNIKIKIRNLNILNFQIDEKCKIYIELYLLDKIKYISIKLNREKIRNIKENNSINNKIKKLSEMNVNLNKKEILSLYKKLNLNIEKFELKINIGFYDACMTSYLTAFIASTIGVFIPYLSENYNEIKYNILPEYEKNIFKLNLKSIFNIKIVHIIYVIYLLVKKGRKKNERTSNRRLNAEQL